jgi:hypothetical protein
MRKLTMVATLVVALMFTLGVTASAVALPKASGVTVKGSGKSCKQPLVVTFKGGQLTEGPKQPPRGFSFLRIDVGNGRAYLSAVFAAGLTQCSTKLVDHQSFNILNLLPSKGPNGALTAGTDTMTNVAGNSITAKLARVRPHKGRNCGSDAIKVIWNPDNNVSYGDTKWLKVKGYNRKATGALYKWTRRGHPKPKICEIYQITRDGSKRLWDLKHPKKSSYQAHYTNNQDGHAANFVVVTARL